MFAISKTPRLGAQTSPEYVDLAGQPSPLKHLKNISELENNFCFRWISGFWGGLFGFWLP